MTNQRTNPIRALVMILALFFTWPAVLAAENVILPPPEPGSFFTVFDYSRDGRVVAFDGFTVFIQQAVNMPEFTAIGTLPETFRGGTDPAFVEVSPDGNTLILGGGAGGFQFPDPAFNGAMFSMPIEGGTATMIGLFPFHIQPAFRNPGELFFGQGETFGFFVGSVELLDLKTGTKQSVVGNIPGDPGGVTFNARGDLFVGLGSASDLTRIGEIRRFDKHDINYAISTGVPLDFDNDSTLIAQVLNAGDLEFGSTGNLFVGGGDLFGITGSFGFIAEIDRNTGRIINRFDPIDGDPDDGDFVFFGLSFTSVQCQLGAVDLFSFFSPADPVVFQRKVCPQS